MRNKSLLGLLLSLVVVLVCLTYVEAEQNSIDPDFAQMTKEQDKDFIEMDRDQDGFISKAEMLDYQAGEFSRMDNSNDGIISRAEYSGYYNPSN